MRDIPRTVPDEALRIPQDRGGAALNRLGDERPAVAMRAGIRREGVAAFHPPAVGGDPRHGHAELREQRRDVFCIGRSGGHLGDHVSSRTSLSSAGRRTLFTGASAGTPRSRSAVPMTLAKTGAATVPP